MSPRIEKSLREMILYILNRSPKGLSHKDLVLNVLSSGFSYDGDLSRHIFRLTNQLVRKGQVGRLEVADQNLVAVGPDRADASDF